MNTRQLTTGALLLTACLMMGCHTPGGGIFRVHSWDHIKSGRSWIMHQYFDPHRYDHHATCWSPMIYDPGACCWGPAFQGQHITEVGPQADSEAEAVEGIPTEQPPAPDGSLRPSEPLPDPFQDGLIPPMPPFEQPGGEGLPQFNDSSGIHEAVVPASFNDTAMPMPDAAPVLRRIPRE